MALNAFKLICPIFSDSSERRQGYKLKSNIPKLNGLMNIIASDRNNSKEVEGWNFK